MTSVLDRIARGEKTAFAECLDSYGGLVWSLARRLSRTPADAEDATQEIYLKLWKNAGRYDVQRGSEAVFIATIARRVLIDRLREHKRRPVEAPIEEFEDWAGATAADGESCAEAKIAAAALAQLRPQEQQVISLSVVQGLSQGDIAERLNMPLGTVKSLMRRGLMAVREKLGEGVRS